ncbi:MAG: phage tail sheath family protein [Thermoanaerobaculia bacterium]
MPSDLTYPGVYIEEVPSGVRTIIGVSTSIAAFVGKTASGPTDGPVVITSFADFERTFGGDADRVSGGLFSKYPIGFAVRDFYLNGGSVAIICRATNGGAAAKTTAHKLKLMAPSIGTWANKIRVRITKPAADATLTDMATRYGVAEADFFHLTIRDMRTGGDVESYGYVTAKPSGRNVAGILQAQSRLLRADGVPDPTAPDAFDATAPPAADEWKDANSTKIGTDGTDSGDLTTAAHFGVDGADPTGLFLLQKADLFNLLVIPPPNTPGEDVPPALHPIAAKFCRDKRALYIVDPPVAWKTTASVTGGLSTLGISGPDAQYASLYFPRVIEADPLQGDQPGVFAASGAIAGVMARTDTTRGVWKAPAGIDASVTGTKGPAVLLSDLENGILNPRAVNCIRQFATFGTVVWGARTMAGDDNNPNDYKYVPIRRLANFIEESLFRGLKWVVFEPNDEPLWAQIRLNAGAFMQDLFRQGAFQGGSARDAYFVHCDKTTTTQNDINKGIVNIIVGFAPLKPAEFVVLKLTQIAGQIQT